MTDIPWHSIQWTHVVSLFFLFGRFLYHKCYLCFHTWKLLRSTLLEVQSQWKSIMSEGNIAEREYRIDTLPSELLWLPVVLWVHLDPKAGSDTSWTGSGAIFPELSPSLDSSLYKRKGMREWEGCSLP